MLVESIPIIFKEKKIKIDFQFHNSPCFFIGFSQALLHGLDTADVEGHLCEVCVLVKFIGPFLGGRRCRRWKDRDGKIERFESVLITLYKLYFGFDVSKQILMEKFKNLRK